MASDMSSQPPQGMPQGQPQPKLIIDTDWKAQAQAEKERLAAQAPPKPAARPAGPVPNAPVGAASPGPTPTAGPEQGQGQGQSQGQDQDQEGLPQEAQLQDLVSLLVTQALVYLGAFPDPKTGQAMVSLEYAKLHIDLLGVLQEKTKGNLKAPEQKLLDRAVGELRMEFVEVAKVVEQAIAQGKLRPQGGSPGIISGGSVPPPKLDFGAPGIPRG